MWFFFFFSLQNALWQAANCLGRWKLSPMSAMDQKTETHIWPVWLQKHEQLFRQRQADVSLQFSTLWEQGLCPFYSQLCPQCVAECLVLCLTNHRCSITSWGMNEWGLSFGVETWLQGPIYTHHHSRALGLLFPGLSRSSESLSLDLQKQLSPSGSTPSTPTAPWHKSLESKGRWGMGRDSKTCELVCQAQGQTTSISQAGRVDGVRDQTAMDTNS